MEIEGAFDNTDFNVITEAARARLVDDVAISRIVKMLSSGTVETSVCGTSTRLGVTRGCSQCGILTPILWSMVIESLLVRLNDSDFFTQSYADDVSSLICGFSASIIGDLMRRALKMVEE